MRKIFTFLFAALMSVSMFAVPQAQQGEPVDVTIGSWYLENGGDDGELFLYSPDSTIRFYFNLFYGQDASDLILGKEYTVGDVFVDENGQHAGIYTDGDWDYGIKSLSLIKTIDADQHVHFVGSVVDIIDRAFTFHYDEEPAPAEPLFEMSYEDKWLNIAPADAEAPYILWLDSKAFYDGKYTEYTQEKMGGYMDYIVGLVNGTNTTDLFLLSGEQKIAPNALLDSQGSSPYSLNDECIAFVFKYDATDKKRVSDVEYFVFTYAGEPEQEEGIEHIVLTEKAQKVIMDGMIYIVRDGKLFNMTGAQVR